MGDAEEKTETRIESEDFEMACQMAVTGWLWDETYNPDYTVNVSLSVAELRYIANLVRADQGIQRGNVREFLDDSSDAVESVPSVAPSARAGENAAMNREQYNRIKDWTLGSHLAEIQDRIESCRVRAARLPDDELTSNLLHLAGWVGHVKCQHAPDTPGGTDNSSDAC